MNSDEQAQIRLLLAEFREEIRDDLHQMALAVEKIGNDLGTKLAGHEYRLGGLDRVVGAVEATVRQNQERLAAVAQKDDVDRLWAEHRTLAETVKTEGAHQKGVSQGRAAVYAALAGVVGLIASPIVTAVIQAVTGP